MKKLLTLLLIILFTGAVFAEEEGESPWIINAQGLMRPELDGRDFTNTTYAPIYTGMRIRLGVEKTLFNDFNFKVQVQDSRYWGQEGGTLNNMMNVDLHQAYAKIMNILDLPLYVQAGRFEMDYGNQRIIGSVQWHLVSRSFDGVRFGWDEDNAKVDVFVANTNNQGVSGVSPAGYKYPVGPDSNFRMVGVYTQWGLAKGHNLDIYGYQEYDGRRSNGVDVNMSRITAGARYAFGIDNLFGHVEGAFQFGKMKTLDIGANLIAVSLGYDFGSLKASVNADISSGTKTEDMATKWNLFDSYATKHAFQGFMDYFLNIGPATGGHGLNDMFLRLIYQEKGSKFKTHLDIHYFTTNTPGMVNGSENSALGPEIDLVLNYVINKWAQVEWGGSVFMPGDYMKELWKVPNTNPVVMREDMSFWSYLMLKVNVN